MELEEEHQYVVIGGKGEEAAQQMTVYDSEGFVESRPQLFVGQV